jgi:hypothetical protein
MIERNNQRQLVREDLNKPVRNAEAGGSIPLCSTNRKQLRPTACHAVFIFAVRIPSHGFEPNHKTQALTWNDGQHDRRRVLGIMIDGLFCLHRLC